MQEKRKRKNLPAPKFHPPQYDMMTIRHLALVRLPAFSLALDNDEKQPLP